MDKKTKRLKVLIEDLFEASKVSSGNIELYLEKLDVIVINYHLQIDSDSVL